MSDEKLPAQLTLGLRSGSVFYLVARELSSLEPHYFVVINRSPLSQKLVLLAVCSSQIEKVLKRRQSMPETVAIIEEGEYQDLPKRTAIDGNQVFSRSLPELADLVRRKEIRYHRELPPILLDRLRTAVLASRLIEEEAKALIR